MKINSRKPSILLYTGIATALIGVGLWIISGNGALSTPFSLVAIVLIWIDIVKYYKSKHDTKAM